MRAISWTLVFAIVLGVVDAIAFVWSRATGPGPALDAWVFVHQPALSIANALLPTPPLHADLPAMTLIAVIFLCLAQATIIGATLGWILQVMLRYGKEHAL